MEEKKEETLKEKPGVKTEAELIEERKKQIIGFFKKTNIWVFVLLIIALILGVYIRSLPMLDHNSDAPGNQPGLWDITTNTWTLGPDLDPFLFLRYAKTIVEQGNLPEVDTMRNVPLGFKTTGETKLLPYMIVLVYRCLHLFDTSINVEFAAAFFPVIVFALTILALFMFVREVFLREGKTKANAIALIATFILIVTPVFLSRTVAGIPEKESVAFFFMFAALYLFLKAWKSEGPKKGILFAVLSGFFTALTGLVWGGVAYLYVAISTASFLAFMLNKFHKKEFIVYSSWILSSLIIIFSFTKRYSFVEGFVVGLDTSIASFVFFLGVVHVLLWDTRLSKLSILNKTKLPRNIKSLLISLVLILILFTLFFGPTFILSRLQALNHILINPVTGRWSVTVAENKQPSFVEWRSSFGPSIKNVPLLFWLFLIGSIVLFKNILKNINKKDAWVLTFLYTFFLFGLIFSRYSPSSILNGENFISKLFYYLSAFILLIAAVYYYMRYEKQGNKGLEEISYEFLLLFALLIICLLTTRSAVRLIMVLAPVAPIFLSYLVVFCVDKFRKNKEELGRVIFGVLAVLLILSSVFIFWSFYKEIKSESYNFVPSSYTQQWQKAMSWVRENTAKDAIFTHWWDYGYWLQSIGHRATVTDGGNAIAYWNYLSGRFVLTGDNQKDALDFLYSHNSSYLLIDSTDIGKYGAFSSIGSNENYDRLSWIPAMISDPSQIQETRNGTIRTYAGGAGVDEDIIFAKDGKEIRLPANAAFIAGVIIEIKSEDNKLALKQPQAAFYFQGNQVNIPLRYAYFNHEFIDFKEGLEAGVYISQRVYQANGAIQKDDTGFLMYFSPRLMRTLFAQIYIFNDPFKKFENFELVHSEQNLIIESLNSQGAGLNEFIYFQEVQGPIKIWKINYSGEEIVKEEYLDTDASKYLSWAL